MKLIRLLALLALTSVAMAENLFEKTNIPPDSLHVFQGQGIDKTGVTDVTAKMTTFLQQGGLLFIPDGDYLVANAGADSGGVDAVMTKSLHVECGPKAVLHGTNLDNDIVRIEVPSTGVGLPTGGISVIWHGCTFDQTTQKTSTSVPFSVTYTSANQGASATTDGLSIRGDYLAGGVTATSGMYYAEVSGVTFSAGTHWQNAGSGSGGDSGLLVAGVGLSQVHDNAFYGNRDVSIYMTNSPYGTLDVRSDIYGNYIKNSFGCVAVKRSSPGFSVHDNTCVNGVVGYGAYWIVGPGDSEGDFHNNRCSGCQVNDRVDYSTNISVHDEKCDNFGAFLADGTTAVTAYTPVGLQLQGVTYSSFRDNTCTSISATYAALNPSFISLADFASVGPTASTNNRLEHNMSVGFHSIGGEAGSADYNEFWENYEYTGSVHFPAIVGTHSSATRYDYAAGTRAYMNPQYFDDGTVSAPMVARRGDTTTGIYFGSSQINFAVGGTEYGTFNGTVFNPKNLVVAAIGTAQQTVASISPSAQVVGAGAGISSSLNGRFTADTSAASRYLLKSRNTTPGSFTTLSTGDCIGRDLFYGDDGTTYNSLAGEIDVCSTGTLGTGIIPGKYFLKLADSTGALKTPLTVTATGTVLGVAGTTTGTEGYSGATSGVVTVQPQAAAGTYNFNLPITAGTSGQPLLSAGGGSSPMTFGTLGVAGGGTGAVTLTGPLKGNGTSAFTAAVAADIYGLWSGSCSSSTHLRGDGACAAVALATDVSGTLPLANGGTAATTAQGATQSLKTRFVVCSSGATVSAGADTSEDTLYDCTIPANSLGANGQIIVQAAFTHTSSSNNKVLRIRYSTVSGTVVWTITDTTTTSVLSQVMTIQNKNATGSQESGVNSGPLNAASSGTYQTEAVDTTQASHIVVTCAKASSGETCSMNRVLVEVIFSS